MLCINKCRCSTFFCVSAIACNAIVVLPEDSGPKISVMRPFGYPPTPKALSNPTEPLEMTNIFVQVAHPIS